MAVGWLRAYAMSGMVALLLIISLVGCDPQSGFRYENVRIGGELFRLELAITDQQIEQGLMGREKLADNEGMLFVFPDDKKRAFWMKNCLIPLDMICLDRNGRIVTIHKMTVPDPNTKDSDLPVYPSSWPARYVIELAADRSQALGLREGDRIQLPHDRLKRLAQ